MKRIIIKHLVTAVVLSLALVLGGPVDARILPAVDGSTIFVGNVEQLYSAVNNPDNAGAFIILSAGRYPLSPADTVGVPRPNDGRLDLQLDMSLLGVDGDRAAATIDASALPRPSFAFKVGRTGTIRTGRGNSTIAWLTVAGNPMAASAICTDLVEPDQADPTGTALPTALRVSHVSAHDSPRGVDVRNAAADASGRRIVAEIEDSEFFRGAEGIRVINFAQADRGEITRPGSTHWARSSRTTLALSSSTLRAPTSPHWGLARRTRRLTTRPSCGYRTPGLPAIDISSGHSARCRIWIPLHSPARMTTL